MRKLVYLRVNPITGECKVSKRLRRRQPEYVYRLMLELPDIPHGEITINMPIPQAPITDVKEV